jgi:hypothetical protein
VAANNTGGGGASGGSPAGKGIGAERSADAGQPFGRGGIEVKPDTKIGLHRCKKRDLLLKTYRPQLAVMPAAGGNF